MCHQFRKSDYTNKRGEAKKKLALATDHYTICELFRTLKATMIFFQNIDTTMHTQKKFINKQSTSWSNNKDARFQWKLHMLGAWWSPVPTLKTNTSDIIPVVTFCKDINGNLLEDHLVYVSDKNMTASLLT